MFLKIEYCWPPAWERKRQREWCSAVGTPCSLLLSVQMCPNPTPQTLLSTAGRKRGCEWERLHCRYEWQNTQKNEQALVLFLPQKKVVEQLRRDLLVKQEDMKMQTLQADGQTSTLLITQTPLPAASLTTPQVPTQNTRCNTLSDAVGLHTGPLLRQCLVFVEHLKD